RLRNLLRDWCPAQRRDVTLVVVAAEERLPALLSSEALAPEARRSLALRHLREERGLDAATAARGVELWTAALEGPRRSPKASHEAPPPETILSPSLSLEDRARELDQEAWAQAWHFPLSPEGPPEERAMDRAWEALFSPDKGVSPEEAAPLLEEAALQGSEEGRRWLAELQDATGYLPGDIAAVREGRRRRSASDPDEAFRLGWDLIRRQAPSGAVEGRSLLRSSGEQGHPGAWGELGRCLEQGIGGSRSFASAAEAYRRSAEGGDGAAAYALGLMYRAGLGVPRDDREGARWIIQASEAGWAEARSTLGALYSSGAGVPRDFSRAAASYREAQDLPLLTEEELFLRRSRDFQRRRLDLGDPKALKAWGERLALGWEGPPDRSRALELLDRLEGDLEARSLARRLRGPGAPFPEDPEKEAQELALAPPSAPIRWYRRLLRQYQEKRRLRRREADRRAQGGDPEALALMGYLILSGRCGEGQDPGAGGSLLRQAAAAGQEEALAWVGRRYFSPFVPGEAGEGIRDAEDRVLARRWVTREAQRGDREAQRRLGILLLEEDLSPPEGGSDGKERGQGILWLERAAAQGDGEAAFFLGAHWDRQGAAPELRREAERWYRAAAAQGHPEAAYRLALRAFYGKPRDVARAVDLYRQAAERGHAVAQNNLGALYVGGVGVPQDFSRALYWFRRAAERGHEGARRNAEKWAWVEGGEGEGRGLWQRLRSWIDVKNRP
ncbi:MAG TPA: tetratricopeptide repeat protein, partial [Synergistaceae bacterium]|nr:tetratricopeptide repeat protein [Synergistaceae bacterium]